MFTPTLYCLLLPLNTHEVSQETGEEQKQKTKTMHKPYKERRRTEEWKAGILRGLREGTPLETRATALTWLPLGFRNVSRDNGRRLQVPRRSPDRSPQEGRFPLYLNGDTCDGL